MANEMAGRKLLDAIYGRQRNVVLEHCPVGSFGKIFDEVINTDPRIIAYIELDKLEYGYRKNSIISLFEDYEVKVEYSDQFMKIDEIAWYKGDYTALQLLDSRSADNMCIVGEDIEKLADGFNAVYTLYADTMEGFEQLTWETVTYKQYTLLYVHVIFSVEKNQLQGLQRKTDFEVKKIVSGMRNIARVPVFLKIFMAFSYISQNCSINRTAQAENLSIGQKTSFPTAGLAYGALVERTAASKGISWALKKLLDALGIESIVISGRITDSFLNSDNYYWNLVKADGVYYHIDVTWNIDMDGIFVGGFMKDDNFVSATHQWYDHYPAAKGTRFDYDYVEDYLAEKGEELLDLGLPEYLLFPEPVNDF